MAADRIGCCGDYLNLLGQGFLPNNSWFAIHMGFIGKRFNFFFSSLIWLSFISNKTSSQLTFGARLQLSVLSR